MLETGGWTPTRTAVGLAVTAFVLLSPSVPMLASHVSAATAWGPANDHIQHIVTIVMENRDYDEYFGEYCLTLGPDCAFVGNGIPSGTCIPYEPADPSLGCIAPYNFTTSQYLYSDLPHNATSGTEALNGGQMNGFYAAEGSSTNAFGHYNGSTIPIYWDLAEEYALSDNTFAGNLSYSLPNHWSLLSGTVPPIAWDSYVLSPADRLTYLHEANSSSTVEDLLNTTNVSWNYYDWSLLPYSQAVNTTGVVADGAAYNFWSPMAGQGQSYESQYSTHFVPRTNFLTDAAAGSLPDLSWLIPPWGSSDHPGTNLTAGEAFVAQAINAVETSPDWSSTAIFLTWDDYGGFYDQVAPPTVFGAQLSFRAPLLVISPYARENYISSQFLDFFSLLHFDEWQFGLGCLTQFDCTAPLPFDLFNFNQTARSPVIFPTVPSAAIYPMPLQPPNYGPLVFRAHHVVVIPLAWNNNSTLPTGVTILDAS
jgi:phospholipase C